MKLLDTDVLIEVRRGTSEARHFLQALGTPTLTVPGLAAMEFLVGSRNRAELDSSRKFVAALDVIWPSEADCQLAYELIARYRLSTGLGLGDFIIAAQAINRDAILYTFNEKHFRAISELKMQIPYRRGE